MSALLRVLFVVLAALTLGACGEPTVHTIGRAGLGDGEFREPRTVAASEHGLAVIDKSGRMQLFDLGGRHLRTIALIEGSVRKGLPCGVAWRADGTLAVADTHQSQVTLYDVHGKKLGRIGEYGAAPGQILFPRRIDVAPDGSLAVSQSGFTSGNRVQVFSRDGTFVRRFGGTAPTEGGLTRPMGVVGEPDGGYLVADQEAGLLRFGPGGAFAGSVEPPGARWSGLLYGLCRADDGTLYGSDIAKNRIVHLDAAGGMLGVYGEPGHGPGRFREPWDVAYHAGYLYVADRMNHRVQRLRVDQIDWRTP
jgi:DNA-binding beta-propeller fold protein YncE